MRIQLLALCVAGAASADPIVIASKQAGPSAIVAGAGGVTWIDEGTGDEASGAIMHAAKGGTPVALATKIPMPLGLAVDATDVYVADAGVSGSLTDVRPRGRVFAVPLAGGKLRVVAPTQWGPRGIAVSAGEVFWTNPGVTEGKPTVVNRAAKKGGAVKAVASGELAPLAVAVDDKFVYWVSEVSCQPPTAKQGVVKRAPIAGGAATVLASGLACPEALALDDANVYVTNTGDGTIVRVAKTGGAATAIVNGENMPRAIAVDDKDVYWVAWRDRSVRKAAKSGGKASEVFRGKQPAGVAVDATDVYITDEDAGTVVQVAKH